MCLIKHTVLLLIYSVFSSALHVPFSLKKKKGGRLGEEQKNKGRRERRTKERRKMKGGRERGREKEREMQRRKESSGQV